METHHVALKGHPVVDLAFVFWLAGFGVLFADKRCSATVAVDLPYAFGCGMLTRQPRDEVCFPDDGTIFVIVAGILFGKIDVDIGLPVGFALCGEGIGLLGILNFDVARLLVVYGVLYLLGDRFAVNGPAKVAALDGALLTVGSCPPARGSYGVKAVGELCGPATDL